MSQSARRYGKYPKKVLVNPRREHHHSSTPVHKYVPLVVHKEIPAYLKRFTRCMYCGAHVQRGEYTRSVCRAPTGRWRPDKIRAQSPRNGVACNDVKQCRRNRRKGAVGSFFRAKANP